MGRVRRQRVTPVSHNPPECNVWPITKPINFQISCNRNNNNNTGNTNNDTELLDNLTPTKRKQTVFSGHTDDISDIVDSVSGVSSAPSKSPTQEQKRLKAFVANEGEFDRRGVNYYVEMGDRFVKMKRLQPWLDQDTGYMLPQREELMLRNLESVIIYQRCLRGFTLFVSGLVTGALICSTFCFFMTFIRPTFDVPGTSMSKYAYGLKIQHNYFLPLTAITHLSLLMLALFLFDQYDIRMFDKEEFWKAVKIWKLQSGFFVVLICCAVGIVWSIIVMNLDIKICSEQVRLKMSHNDMLWYVVNKAILTGAVACTWMSLSFTIDTHLLIAHVEFEVKTCLAELSHQRTEEQKKLDAERSEKPLNYVDLTVREGQTD